MLRRTTALSDGFLSVVRALSSQRFGRRAGNTRHAVASVVQLGGSVEKTTVAVPRDTYRQASALVRSVLTPDVLTLCTQRDVGQILRALNQLKAVMHLDDLCSVVGDVVRCRIDRRFLQAAPLRTLLVLLQLHSTVQLPTVLHTILDTAEHDPLTLLSPTHRNTLLTNSHTEAAHLFACICEAHEHPQRVITSSLRAVEHALEKGTLPNIVSAITLMSFLGKTETSLTAMMLETQRRVKMRLLRLCGSACVVQEDGGSLFSSWAAHRPAETTAIVLYIASESKRVRSFDLHETMVVRVLHTRGVYSLATTARMVHALRTKGVADDTLLAVTSFLTHASEALSTTTASCINPSPRSVLLNGFALKHLNVLLSWVGQVTKGGPMHDAACTLHRVVFANALCEVPVELRVLVAHIMALHKLKLALPGDVAAAFTRAVGDVVYAQGKPNVSRVLLCDMVLAAFLFKADVPNAHALAHHAMRRDFADGAPKNLLKLIAATIARDPVETPDTAALLRYLIKSSPPVREMAYAKE